MNIEAKQASAPTPDTGAAFCAASYRCEPDTAVRLVDARININAIAWAALALLDSGGNYAADLSGARMDDDDEELRARIEFQTWPWLNGTESGFAILGRDHAQPGSMLVVTFAASSGLDGVFVDHWLAGAIPYRDPPTNVDMPGTLDELNRRVFTGPVAAAECVRDIVERWARGEICEGGEA